MRHLDTDHLKLVAEDLLEVLRSNFNNVRMMPYIFSCLDHLCSSGCLDPVFKTLSEPLFGLIRAEMSSGSKPLKVNILKHETPRIFIIRLYLIICVLMIFPSRSY